MIITSLENLDIKGKRVIVRANLDIDPEKERRRKVVDVILKTPFSNAKRHARRISKIENYEELG